MTHYTLNTGHTSQSLRSGLAPEEIERCRPLLVDGRHPLPDPGYHLMVSIGLDKAGLLATVYSADDRALATIGVAPNDLAADNLWPWLERHYYDMTDLPGLRKADFTIARRPESTPWVAAIVLYPWPDEAYWIGRFERCLAWAWIESLEGD